MASSTLLYARFGSTATAVRSALSSPNAAADRSRELSRNAPRGRWPPSTRSSLRPPLRRSHRANRASPRTKSGGKPASTKFTSDSTAADNRSCATRSSSARVDAQHSAETHASLTRIEPSPATSRRPSGAPHEGAGALAEDAADAAARAATGLGRRVEDEARSKPPRVSPSRARTHPPRADAADHIEARRQVVLLRQLGSAKRVDERHLKKRVDGFAHAFFASGDDFVGSPRSSSTKRDKERPLDYLRLASSSSRYFFVSLSTIPPP